MICLAPGCASTSSSLAVESQRFTQPFDQRYRRPTSTILNVSDVAGLNADSSGQIALGHSGLIRSLFHDRPCVLLVIVETLPDAARRYPRWRRVR